MTAINIPIISRYTRQFSAIHLLLESIYFTVNQGQAIMYSLQMCVTYWYLLRLANEIVSHSILLIFYVNILSRIALKCESILNQYIYLRRVLILVVSQSCILLINNIRGSNINTSKNKGPRKVKCKVLSVRMCIGVCGYIL